MALINMVGLECSLTLETIWFYAWILAFNMYVYNLLESPYLASSLKTLFFY